MSSISFAGQNVLIAEDEVIIAYDLAQAFENAGATVTTSHSLDAALAAVRSSKFDTAVIDVKLKADLSGPLCALLQCMNVPFVIYTGCADISGFKYKTCIIQKPAAFEEIAAKLERISERKKETVRKVRVPKPSRRVERMSKMTPSLAKQTS